MKYRDFKFADLFVFTLLAVASEFFGYFLVGKLNMDAPFYISFSIAISIIAIVRWGVVGIVPFLFSGISLIYLKGSGIGEGILLEVVANLFLIIPFLFIINKKRDLIINDKVKMLALAIASILSLYVGKGIAIFIIEGEALGGLGYFTNSLFIILMNLLIIAFLINTKSELLRDMKSYILESKTKEEE